MKAAGLRESAADTAKALGQDGVYKEQLELALGDYKGAIMAIMDHEATSR